MASCSWCVDPVDETQVGEEEREEVPVSEAGEMNKALVRRFLKRSPKER